jgi:hypothetical protein
MARHRAVSSSSQDNSAAEGSPERRPDRSGLDAVPLWTGLLLTVAEGVNRWWFTAFAWLAVAVRSAMAVLSARRSGTSTGRRIDRTRFGVLVRLFRFMERRYGENHPSGRASSSRRL